eukprot:scaffold47345_cov18-Tisochrysis_lutea.AAC.1
MSEVPSTRPDVRCGTNAEKKSKWRQAPGQSDQSFSSLHMPGQQEKMYCIQNMGKGLHHWL